MADTRFTEAREVPFPAATVEAALPEFWPKLGLGSTLRRVPGAACRFTVSPPDFVPSVDLPIALDVVPTGQGSRVAVTVDLPGDILDGVPGIGKVPFGKKIAMKAIGNTLKLVVAACVTNLDAFLRNEAGQPTPPVHLTGTRMTFASGPGASFNLPYATVEQQLPALWAELPVALTLQPTATPGRFAIQSGPYAVLPVTGFVQISALGAGRTGVGFEAAVDAPLSELPRFVPKGMVASKAQEGLAEGLHEALRQCEQLMIARQRRAQGPEADGIGA